MKVPIYQILSAASLLMLTACSQIEGNSLLTNQRDDSSTLAVDKTPKPEELYLKTFNSSVVATGASKVEISGECYVSTFPSHRIIVTEGVNILDVMDVNPSTNVNAKSAVCANGRFNLALNAGPLTAGTHSIRFVLQAFNGTNQPITNDVQGVSNLILTK